MLPRSYRDLFKGPLGIQFEYLPHSGYRQPSGEFSQFLPISPIWPKSPFPPKSPLAKGPHFPSNLNRPSSGKFCHFRQNRHSPRGECSKFAIFAKSVIFAKIANFAIFAKIAPLQRASFRIQFELPALWQFFAIFAIQICHFCQYRQNRHPLQGATFSIHFRHWMHFST